MSKKKCSKAKIQRLIGRGAKRVRVAVWKNWEFVFPLDSYFFQGFVYCKTRTKAMNVQYDWFRYEYVKGGNVIVY